MSKCNFTLTLLGTTEEAIGKVKAQIENNNGSFDGNAQSGAFSVNVLGTIKGSYTIAGQQMDISIDSKPLFISCQQIEGYLKNNMGSIVA